MKKNSEFFTDVSVIAESDSAKIYSVMSQIAKLQFSVSASLNIFKVV